MQTLKITYLIDDENMSDEEYDNQEEKVVNLSVQDLEEIIKYGSIPRCEDIPRTATVDIISTQFL